MMSDAEGVKYRLLELLVINRATTHQIHDFCVKTGSPVIKPPTWVIDELTEDADWEANHLHKETSATVGNSEGQQCTPTQTQVLTYEDDQLINRQVYDDGSGFLCIDEQMVNGIKHGLGMIYAGSFTLINYLNGKKHGRQLIFDHRGNLAESITYKHGIRLRKQELYDDGEHVYRATTYLDDQPRRIETYKVDGAGLKSVEEIDVNGH